MSSAAAASSSSTLGSRSRPQGSSSTPSSAPRSAKAGDGKGGGDDGFPPPKQTLSEAMQRLLEPSLKEKGNALDVAQIAMLNLEKIMIQLKDTRAKCEQRIQADKAEMLLIEKEEAEIKQSLAKVRSHCDELGAERDVIESQLESSKKIFTDAVHNVHKMINKTNSNVARLQRTQVPKRHENFLKSGKKEK